MSDKQRFQLTQTGPDKHIQRLLELVEQAQAKGGCELVLRVCIDVLQGADELSHVAKRIRSGKKEVSVESVSENVMKACAVFGLGIEEAINLHEGFGMGMLAYEVAQLLERITLMHVSDPSDTFSDDLVHALTRKLCHVKISAS